MAEPEAQRSPVDIEAVARRMTVLRDRIDRARATREERGSAAGQVTVLAVTKGFGVDAVSAAAALGLAAVGENYAQELAAKFAAFEATGATPVEWHFIGQLQSKRVRTIAGLVSVWQSVDRVKVGAEIAKHAPGARVMVQVNATGETQKAGCDPDAVAPLVENLNRLGLDVTGLMTLGRAGDEDETREAFRLVAGLADTLGLPERSMGMSEDLELAVQEGSTMVRVGTALFGPRGPR